MKKQYKLLSIMLTGALLTACSNEGPELLPHQAPAAFSATIGKSVSRAAGAEWDGGDAIGISGVSGDKIYTNVKHVTASGDGNFTPAGESIFYQTADPVTFTAYYPYEADGGVISVSTADQSAQSSFDFLWAQGTGSNSAPDVCLNFKHCMSQLNISFTNGNDVDLSDLTFTLDGLVADGTFDTATGEATITDGSASATLTSALNAASKASLIVLPQAAGRLTVNARASGQQYRCTFALGPLVPGSSYNVSIAVSKTEMTVTSATIEPWTDSDLPDIEAGLVVRIGDKNASEAAVGDFYMNDGSLVDKDAVLTDEQTAACIGIVFTTDPARIGEGAKAALATKGIAPHGLVMALTNAVDDTRWGNAYIDEPGLPNNIYVNAIYNDVEGYGETQWIIKNHADRLSDIYTAFYYTSLYGKTDDTSKYATPAVSTDWFMPSAGNWWDILRNLGKVESLDSYTQSEIYAVTISNATPTIVTNLNTYISKIENSSKFTVGSYFWASTEDSNMEARFIGLYANGNLLISSLQKEAPVGSVRCVLAF